MIGTFAPSDSALLLIDHQVGTMQLIKNIPSGQTEHSGVGQDGQDSWDPRGVD